MLTLISSYSSMVSVMYVCLSYNATLKATLSMS